MCEIFFLKRKIFRDRQTELVHLVFWMKQLSLEKEL